MKTQINGLYKIIFIITLFLSTESFSLEKGKWTFTKDKDWCYIGSIPLLEEGNYTKRGDTYFLVYRINNQPNPEIQINAGYNYSETKEVEVIIDNNKNLLSIVEGDTAWTENDKKIIESMKKGKEMIVKGTSSRGTLTTDTYTLIGFTAAYNKLKKDC